VLGVAGPVGVVSGAGEDIDAEVRVGQAAAEPTLKLAVGGGGDNGEVLAIVRALARRGGVVSNPVPPEVNGLARIAEDAIGGDLVAVGEIARVLTDADARPNVVSVVGAIVGDQIACGTS